MEQQLLDAVRGGRIDEVKRLLAEQPTLVAAKGPDGSSAILLAVYHRRPEIADLFESHGVALDIFEACALGRVDRIRAILAADPSQVSAYAPDGFYPLGLAAFFGHLDAVRALIDAGADVHAAARNPTKVQPIHAATASRNMAIVKAVLDAGADPNARQQQGYLPLHEASENGNRPMAELLVAYGADPRLADDTGQSIIERARAKGHLELADWMAGLGG